MAISADIQQQVFDLLSKTSNLSFVRADRDHAGSIGLTPGQKVVAEVRAVLPDGRTQVTIGPNSFNLNLPMEVKQGQGLELTFVSNAPRVTFAVARQGTASPLIALSDASRLLGLLTGNEQLSDPHVRVSLRSVAEILRSSQGSAGTLASLMDEALTYGAQPGSERSGQPKLAPFEANVSQILRQLAQNSKFTLVEASNLQQMSLPLNPGQNIDAVVLGTLPGGRVLVTAAGSSLELMLSRFVAEGEILSLTVVSTQPKLVFALPRSVTETVAGDSLSDAGHWLSALERSQGALSPQQHYVLERLSTVLKNLPPSSPAFTAIMDEAITYGPFVEEGQHRQTVQIANTETSGLAASQAAFNRSADDNMIILLQAIIKGDRLALAEALNQQNRPIAFTPGQQLKGDVLAALGGGHFLLQIAEQLYEFNLSKRIRPGDRLTLFFITNDPTPTFLVTRFGLRGDSTLSETSRWVNGFLGTTPEKAPISGVFNILRILLSGMSADALQVSETLRRGVRESGMFYESHLARWFSGDYSLEDIFKEPQGALSPFKQSAIAAKPAIDGGKENILSGLAKNISMSAMETAFKKAGDARDSDRGIDERCLPLVRDQLETLRSGQLILRGEFFAGQPFEWRVSEREAGHKSADAGERDWNTTIKVNLPRLGAVTAKLSLNSNKVAIDLQTDNPASCAVFDQGRELLAEQLQAAGLEPGTIGIHHEPS